MKTPFDGRQPSMEEDLHIAGSHMALDIFRFAVFFLQCQITQVLTRPGNNSGLSGILGFGSEIFCENAVVATQEIVIVHCESLESELLTEKTEGKKSCLF